MANIDNLKRQHIDIKQLIGDIKKLIQMGIEKNSMEIAKNINSLSGKLKIHLKSEDDYLYPNLLKSNNQDLKKKAKLYIDEMGGMANLFFEFKENFNTSNKILSNINNFEKESQNIISKIESRIYKEEKDIYILAEEN